MGITFAVDEVEAVRGAMVTSSLAERFPDTLALSSPEARVLSGGDEHPLLHAVHTAFAQHRPLTLSPDAVWITIAQGVAQHVRLNADRLRTRLVRHQGVDTLAVSWGGPPPTDMAGWTRIIDAFRAKVADAIGDGRARLFTCDFSTTTEASRVASEIVLMDAMSPFFRYELMCICGIPTVTLEGTALDWRAIRARIDVIEELELATWARSLRPILDHFVRAAEGHADVAFWRRIYKPKDAYGGDVITGWIARLFPYQRGRGEFDGPNPLLALALDDDPRADGQLIGIRSDSAPAGLSKATLHVDDQTSGTRYRLSLQGGLMGTQVGHDGAIGVLPGFAIRHAKAAANGVLARLVRKLHAGISPEAVSRRNDEDDGALLDQLQEAQLFGGTWRVRHHQARGRLELVNRQRLAIVASPAIELPDGNTLFVMEDGAIVRAHLAEIFQPVRSHASFWVDDEAIIGTSLAEVLEWAADHPGEALPSRYSFAEWLRTLERS